MRSLLRLLAVAFLPTLLAPAPDDRDLKAASFAKALAGDWEWTLEYRDDSTDERVKLPTTLKARPSANGQAAVLKFRYDEGKGRFVEAENTLRVDSSRHSLTWESDGGKTKAEYKLTGLDAFAGEGKRELILDGSGTENGQRVEVRQTMTRDGDDLKIAKETRKSGGVFTFRNAYAFKREPTPAPAAKVEAP